MREGRGRHSQDAGRAGLLPTLLCGVAVPCARPSRGRSAWSGLRATATKWFSASRGQYWGCAAARRPRGAAGSSSSQALPGAGDLGAPRPQSAGAGRRGPRALVRYGQAPVLRQPQSRRVRAWDRAQQNAPERQQGGKLNTHREYIYVYNRSQACGNLFNDAGES